MTPSFLTARNASEVLEHLSTLPPESIIFLDIDDTLITPASKAFRILPYKKLIEEIKHNKEHYPNYEEIISNWRMQRQVMLLDKAWPQALQTLQTKFPVYGLTKVDTGRIGNIPSMEEWRAAELASLGIHFSQNPNMAAITKSTSSVANFHAGIFMTGTDSKGKTLEKYLLQFPVTLTTIVLVDDKQEQLEDILQFCNTHSLKFIGILYKGLETFQDKPDPEIVAFQQRYLIENAQWLEDDAAAKLLHSNTLE